MQTLQGNHKNQICHSILAFDFMSRKPENKQIVWISNNAIKNVILSPLLCPQNELVTIIPYHPPHLHESDFNSSLFHLGMRRTTSMTLDPPYNCTLHHLETQSLTWATNLHSRSVWTMDSELDTNRTQCHKERQCFYRWSSTL